MDKLLQIRIQVSIQPEDYSSGGLNLAEEFKVNAVQFTEMCKILGHFHDLAVKIETERGVKR